MKKKFTFITLISLAALSLTGCQYFNEFMSFMGWSTPNFTGESDYQFSDVSTPPAGSLVAKKPSSNFGDMIENCVYPLSVTPSLGRAKLLVIPIWFNDSSSFIKEDHKELVRQDIQKAYFGTNEEVGWYSVKTFYETESHGALTIAGTVSEWRELTSPYRTYANDPDTSKTVRLVDESVDWYFKTHSSEKRTDYDLDGDGYLDGVMLIYAAPDYSTLNNEAYDNLWAYCFWIQDYSVQNVAKPGTNAFFWASYDFMYGKEKVGDRTGYASTTLKPGYINGDTSHMNVDTHTYIHEMGHMFGLEDYYDYSKNSYSPAAAFSMQDCNVGGHDPYSVYVLGWGKAYVPTSSTIIDLKPFTTSGEMILLSPNFNSYNSPFDEYLLLEYYTADGVNELDTSNPYMHSYSKDYPTGSKTPGIRLWHVDSRLVYTTDGNFFPSHFETNPKTTKGRVTLAMSNTFLDGTENAKAYASVLVDEGGENYANFNLLQLIHNDTTATYKSKVKFTKDSLFLPNDTFSMSNFTRQFVNKNKLNNSQTLGFSFKVNATNSTYASIEIIKE